LSCSSPALVPNPIIAQLAALEYDVDTDEVKLKVTLGAVLGAGDRLEDAEVSG
jgi:hypothetical protein